MKSFNVLLVLLLMLCNCKDKNAEEAVAKKESSSNSYTFYGEEIGLSEIKTAEEVVQLFSQLGSKDTLELKLKGKITSVCKAKGCWMEMQLPKEQTLRICFKDYGFFVPTDSENKIAVVQGKGYRREIDVEEQRHYALDASKDPIDIEAIKRPKTINEFVADGVVFLD